MDGGDEDQEGENREDMILVDENVINVGRSGLQDGIESGSEDDGGAGHGRASERNRHAGLDVDDSRGKYDDHAHHVSLPELDHSAPMLRKKPTQLPSTTRRHSYADILGNCSEDCVEFFNRV